MSAASSSSLDCSSTCCPETCSPKNAMQEWSSGYNYSDYSTMLQSSLGWISTAGYQPANANVSARSFPLFIGELGAFVSSHNVSIAFPSHNPQSDMLAAQECSCSMLLHMLVSDHLSKRLCQHSGQMQRHHVLYSSGSPLSHAQRSRDMAASRNWRMAGRCAAFPGAEALS